MRILIAALLLMFSAATASAADIAASASRSSGVAPLYVNFNADIDRSTTTVHTFHELEYSWDFGDTSAGTWGTSGKSKNSDKGPIAAHVYETAGSYTATLTVRNGSGVVGEPQEFSITVTNPDTVFTGTATTCISNNTDFTGCPSGATQRPNISSTLATELVNATGAGERVLLRRGGAWSVGAEVSFPDNSGPVSIGAFGTCTSPNALTGICSNAPQITMTGGQQFIAPDNKYDWRLADISFVNSGGSFVVFGSMKIDDFLMLRLSASGFGMSFGWSHWRNDDTDYHDKIGLISCRTRESMASMIDGERMAIMGNDFADAPSDHVLRVQNIYRGVIGHNYISGSSYSNSDGQHALKLHGPMPTGSANPNGNGFYKGTYAVSGATGVRNWTEFVVVSNNVFGQSAPWPVSIGPQDSAVAEQLSDIIFEKNRQLSDYGTQNHTNVMVGAMFEGRYFTVRNNIFDGYGGYSDYIGVSIERRGVEWTPLGNSVYNNTIYSQQSHTGGSIGVHVGADASTTFVRNNLVSFPATSSVTSVDNDGTGSTVSNNVATTTPYFNDPDNATPLSRDFSLTSSSTAAIDQGYAAPVWDDYFSVSRTGTMDVGADSYETGTTITCYPDVDSDLYPGTGSESVATCSSNYYISSHFTAMTADCDDSSATINPGATDTCGDGIDQDCSGADLACSGGGGARVGSGGMSVRSGGGRFQ